MMLVANVWYLHSLLQIQRITENVLDCSVPTPSVRPHQHFMPLSETTKKKTQEESLVEDKQITPKPTIPENTNATKPQTTPCRPKIDVSFGISTH